MSCTEKVIHNQKQSGFLAHLVDQQTLTVKVKRYR